MRAVQRIVFFFLIGFFFGGIFYFIFCDYFSGLSVETYSSGFSVSLLISSICHHGKYYALLWLLSTSRFAYIYPTVFTVYTGVRNGFLMLYFMCASGFYGLALYFVSLFPHAFLFVPLYIYSFYLIRKEKAPRHRVLIILLLICMYGAGCYMETRVNLPLMSCMLS